MLQSSADDVYVKCAREQDISTKHQPGTLKELESQEDDILLQVTAKVLTKTEKKGLWSKEILEVNIMYTYKDACKVTICPKL